MLKLYLYNLYYNLTLGFGDITILCVFLGDETGGGFGWKDILQLSLLALQKISENNVIILVIIIS